MSALAYGRLVRDGAAADRDRGLAPKDGDSNENKLVTAVAGLVPVEVIAGHALILAATTSTDQAGTTTITQAAPLQWSLVGLVVVTVVLYLIGRGLKQWTAIDDVRLVIPPLAFVIWTALIGSSALSPWIKDLAHAWVTVVAVLVGIVLVVVSAKAAPSKST
ncbi:MAG: hypothetical protein ACRDGI_05565 [Candidatus Limnocylindrales bacterium]